MSGKKQVNLALQGGGAHGAFTWGVLDRLLEIDELEIAGVSGTSAGAINGTALVYGLLRGGKEKARQVLYNVWAKNAELALYSPFQPTFLDWLVSPGNIKFNPFYLTLDNIMSIYSPYQINPLDVNPIEGVIKEFIDFKTIQKNDKIKLFLSATNVKASKIRVFKNHEITPKAVLASAALPKYFQAVEIDGEYYWDGGFIGNPYMYPLLKYTDCRDLLIIQVQITYDDNLPMTAPKIQERETNISFNSSLMQEVRQIHFINNMIDKGFDNRGKLKKVNIHLIEASNILKYFDMSSKENPTWIFVNFLKEKGREKAERWLEKNYDHIGEKSSCDVKYYFY